jgi:ABC-type multidrug transport system fused ATPase/permease subunit
MWTAMRPYARQVAGLLSVGSLCGVLMNTAVVLPAILLGHAVDVVLAHDRGEADAAAVTRAVLLLVAGALATELPRIGKRYWLGVARNRIQANVRADALGGVLSWPPDRLHTTPVGEVMARIVGDVAVLGRGVGEVIVETWDTLLFSLALAVAMLVYDPTLGLLALAPVPVALVLSRAVGARVADRTVRARQANAAVTSFAQEGLTGLRVLKASGRGAAHAARLRGLADAQADAELAAARLQAGLAPVYTVLVTAGVLAIVWLGGHRVVSGALSIGDLVALLALFGRFTGRAFRIPQMANRVQAAAAAYGRLAPLLAPPPALDQEPPRAGWRADRIAGLPDDPEPPPLLLITNVLRRRVRDAERTTRAAVGTVNAELAEDLAGVEVIRAFGRQRQFDNRFRRALRGWLRAGNRSVLFNAFYAPVLGVLAAAVTALLLWLGGRDAFAAIGVSIGTLTAFVLLFARFFTPLTNLGDEWQTVQAALAGAERVFAVLELPTDRPARPEPHAEAARRPPSRKAPAVLLREVTFGYEPDRPVLAGSTSPSRPVGTWPSSDAPAPASPPSCRWRPACTPPGPGRSGWPEPTHPSSTTAAAGP